jgi:diguanylate cyclase (GGDEF)-like protein/PAS domain S-box-containing protein
MDTVAINAVVSANAAGRITHFNPAAERTFGYAATEVTGEPLVKLLVDVCRSPYLMQVEQLFSSEDAENAGRTIELIGLRKDRSEFPLELCIVTWKTAPGSLYTCVVRDITRRKDTERQRDHLLRRVEAMARTDDLTGLANRRAWDEELRREVERATRHGYQLHVVMLDLDHFKVFNDTQGHQAGDAILREVGAVWRLAARVTDFVARYGGDEFALLLPDCSRNDATAVVNRLRAALPDGLTFSAGLAHWDGELSPDELIARADAALYEAKRAGRNQTLPSHDGRR